MGEPGLYSGNRHRHIPLPSMGHYFRSSRGSRHWRTVGWQTHTRSSQSRAGRFCRISLGGNFKGIALRLFRGCLHLCSILISFLSFLRRKTKNFFSSGMMMARSIVRGDCPCIFQPLSSETVVFSISPLLLRYTPQCYGARQGRRVNTIHFIR